MLSHISATKKSNEGSCGIFLRRRSERRMDGSEFWETEERGFVMENNKVYQMSFAKIYPMLISKVEKKGRTRDELDQVTSWLTGYSKDQIENFLLHDIAYGDFFSNAPVLNPNRKKITGTICGVRVENIKEPLMQEIRYLDKLVDELAK